MMKRIFPIINAVIAVTAGVFVLLGYFIDPILFANQANLSDFQRILLQFAGIRVILLKWSVLLAGIAVMIGVGNLFSVHWQKITQRKPGSMYSVVLLLFFLLTFVLVIGARYAPALEAQLNLVDAQNFFLNGIMVPTEISLMALLTVTLLYSSVRMLRWRIDWKTILFLLAALLALVSMGPMTSSIPVIGDVVQVFSTGGARGILIGVALGTLTTGLRILFTADRPYGGK